MDVVGVAACTGVADVAASVGNDIDAVIGVVEDVASAVVVIGVDAGCVADGDIVKSIVDGDVILGVGDVVGVVEANIAGTVGIEVSMDIAWVVDTIGVVDVVGVVDSVFVVDVEGVVAVCGMDVVGVVVVLSLIHI